MAGSASDYLEDELLDHVFGGSDYSRPSTVYVALFSALSSDGSTYTELSGSNYSRVSVTNNATNWPAASGGTKTNGASITFPTASADWDEATHFGIFDASTGGNLLVWADLDTARTVLSGTYLAFFPGTLLINLD